ncbi:MAG: hypothetical protein PHF57_14135 [Methanoregula sp.]|jgi:hypothetical protein|nr:hypothetical protein [Methanoregula sp.]MDD5025016.1 hypothetical protein [Methanoregula sp.]MDD5189341.1 hypothetical protein [Methanoregula sp.]
MNLKTACAVICGAVFLVVVVYALTKGVPLTTAATPHLTPAGAALWNDRTYEVLLQGLIILAGVVSILLLLGNGRLREMHP